MKFYSLNPHRQFFFYNYIIGYDIRYHQYKFYTRMTSYWFANNYNNNLFYHKCTAFIIIIIHIIFFYIRRYFVHAHTYYYNIVDIFSFILLLKYVWRVDFMVWSTLHHQKPPNDGSPLSYYLSLFFTHGNSSYLTLMLRIL